MSEQQKIYFVVFVHFYFSICKILKRAKRVFKKKKRSISIKFTPKSRFRICIYIYILYAKCTRGGLDN